MKQINNADTRVMWFINTCDLRLRTARNVKSRILLTSSLAIMKLNAKLPT